MAFEKGESGNPAGRPKGATNKIGRELREMIANFLVENFAEVKKEFQEVKGEKKVKLWCELLAFIVPKPRPEDEDEIKRLSEGELNQLMHRVDHVIKEEVKYVETGT